MIVHAHLLVVATLTIVGGVAFVAIVAGSVALGIWLAKRLMPLTRSAGAPEVSFRKSLKRSRAKLREQLTPGERRLFYTYSLVSPLLAPIAIGLLVFGTTSTRGFGIGLLIVALLLMAVPISPLMRARIRRREARAAAGDPPSDLRPQ